MVLPTAIWGEHSEQSSQDTESSESDTTDASEQNETFWENTETSQQIEEQTDLFTRTNTGDALDNHEQHKHKSTTPLKDAHIATQLPDARTTSADITAWLQSTL